MALRKKIQASYNNSGSLSLEEEWGGVELRGEKHRDSPDYTDIDAAQRRQSDYINWDAVPSDEDGDEVDNVGFTGVSIRGSGYAPSIKLHSHPLLKKSRSVTSEEDTPPSSTMAELIRQARRPKNRAPPPPPGAVHVGQRETTGEKESATPVSDPVSSRNSRVDSAQAIGKWSGHKRTKSDQPLDDSSSRNQGTVSPSQRSPNGERRVSDLRPKGHHGRLSPAPPPPVTGQGHRSPVQGRKFPEDANQGSSSSPQNQQERKRISAHLQQRATPNLYGPSGAYDGTTSAAAATTTSTAIPKSKNIIPTRPTHSPGHAILTPKLVPPPPPPGQAPVLSKVASPSGPAPAPPNESGRNHLAAARHVREDKRFSVPNQTASSADRSHDQVYRSHAIDSTSNENPSSTSSSASNTPTVKPKRHAPPPPVGGVIRRSPNASPDITVRGPPPPGYAEVMKRDNHRREGREDVREHSPPKPRRLNRTQSMDDLSCSTTSIREEVHVNLHVCNVVYF